MIKSKADIANYINSCEKCFAAFKGKKYPYTLIIEHKLLYNDMLIVGIEEKTEESLNEVSLDEVAVTMWNKIKGYQLKGYQFKENDMSGKREKNDDILNNYMDSLNDKGIVTNGIIFMMYKIEEIFHVTPGELAGRKVRMIL